MEEPMQFIFMLTASDRTVPDAPDVLESVAPLGLAHIGFKDIGADAATLRRLVERTREIGATSYLEVVAETPESALRSARIAVDIGVDCLLGGTQVAETLAILSGTGIRYLPFVGRPGGHPTTLYGTPETVAEDCRRFEGMGCAGVDLLAYRAMEADPLALVAAARGALDGTLLVAGSIDSPDRIAAIASAGADAFTIGSAVFTGRFAPGKPAGAGQLADIIAACGGLAGTGRSTAVARAKPAA